MRRFFRLCFGVAIFASLLTAAARAQMTAPAQAQSDAVYLATYVEALPFEALSAPSGIPALLQHYRDASRDEVGNLRFNVFTELERPNRFVIFESWRDVESFDAHAKADSTAKFRQAMESLQDAPLDVRNIAALFTNPQPHDNRPGFIYVVTHIDVTGDHKDDAVALLRSMRDDTVRDDGNLRYDVFQQKNRPNHFTVVEAWANRKAQANHIAAPHTRDFRRQLLPMQGALYDERIYMPLP